MADWQPIAEQLRRTMRWRSLSVPSAIADAHRRYDAGLSDLCTVAAGHRFLLLEKRRGSQIKSRRAYFRDQPTHWKMKIDGRIP
jgi:hypothetical protein